MPSFDVVSRVEMQEVDNALQQARKEIQQRYDFKDSKTEVDFDQEKTTIAITSDDEFRVKAVVEILQGKLAKRNVSLKSLEYGKIEPAAGGHARQSIKIHQGLEMDDARELVKKIKSSKLKVQAQVQDDQVRVTGKKRDDLQEVIQLLRGLDFRRPLQFVNMRE
ncbi:MAG: YajQ family cyclic di-GMP-binding protein [Deltaproteobacteria bacterium]|nr:YajQ family cyclic di-GMP-binding protein [Deltaproteobacteria bacterium]